MDILFVKNLIMVENKNENVSDILWRNYSFDEYVIPRSKISTELALELSIFLENDKLANFGKMLNNKEVIMLLAKSTKNNILVNALAGNPYADEECLKILLKKHNCKIAEDRLNENIKIMSSNIIDEIDSIINNKDACFISNIYNFDYLLFIEIICNINDDSLLYLVLDQVDNRDNVIYDILIGNNSKKNKYIGRSLASWLFFSNTEMSKLAEEIIDINYFKSNILAKLDNEASRIFYRSDKYKNVRFKNIESRTGMTKDTLDSLVLLGSSSDEIANLIFNSKFELDINNFKNFISGCSKIRIINYLQGEYNRTPTEEEINYLSNILFDNNFDKISSIFDINKIKDCDWFVYLVLYIPNLYYKLDNIADYEYIKIFIEEYLFNNEKSWEVFITMSSEWSGSLYDLVMASSKI